MLRQDILNTSGYLQLCAGRCGSCEVFVHGIATKNIFDDAKSDEALLVDAAYAINSLNHHSAFLELCPSFDKYVSLGIQLVY